MVLLTLNSSKTKWNLLLALSRPSIEYAGVPSLPNRVIFASTLYLGPGLESTLYTAWRVNKFNHLNHSNVSSGSMVWTLDAPETDNLIEHWVSITQIYLALSPPSGKYLTLHNLGYVLSNLLQMKELCLICLTILSKHLIIDHFRPLA